MSQGYFYHTAEISYYKSEGNCYYDLWDNGEPDTTSGGVYNLYLFTDRALDVIATHAAASSLSDAAAWVAITSSARSVKR